MRRHLGVTGAPARDPCAKTARSFSRHDKPLVGNDMTTAPHDHASRPAPQPNRQCDHRRSTRSSAGAAPGGRRRARERVPKGHKMAVGRRRRRRADPQVRPDHRLRLASRSRRASGCTSTIACVKDFARDYHFGEDARPRDDRARSSSSRPSRAIRRANGKVGTRNYLGDPHLGELLGDRRAADRARGRALRHARRLSECRRRHRAGSRHGLRHGRQGRGLRDPDAHPMGLRRQSRISARR